MKVLLNVLALAAVHSACATKVTPVQKVIQLMEGMATKGKEEKHAEQVQFAAYKQFCDDATTEKTRLIKEAEEKIEVLKADIEKNAANVDRLAKEMADLEEDIATQDADMKAATDVRKGEKATYDKTHKDYSESIDALGRAVQVLKKQSGDKAQAAASFLQLQSMTMMPEDTKRAIAAFMQDGEDLEEAAPEANGYEFQSSGVVEMLSKLEDKFVAELTTLEKEESGKKNVYELLMQDLTAQSEQAKSDVTSKTEQKAKNIEDKAAAESDLNDTSDAMAADKKYTADLSATCDQKATDFEARQQLRSEELEAINKAIEIIAGGAVSGNADKHLPSMLQTGVAFAQLRMTAESRSYERAAAFLSSRATELNSRVLMAIAQRAQADPFGKVRKMIQDLIVKLMEEANEESEHKGWCDTELSTNEKTRKEKTEAVETLHASIDQLSAQIAKLAEDITETSKEVSELDEKMAEATELRQKEKAKNAETISDAQAAETATAQAITVLKEFYSKAGDATAFVQQDPEAPEVFDTPYKGMGAESGGIIGFLEVVLSDFARLEAETSSAEDSAQEAYSKFMDESNEDIAVKDAEVEHKTSSKETLDTETAALKKELDLTQEELDAAMDYYEKLKPDCVDQGLSYEDRVKAREAEIQSLQEALEILGQQDLA